MKRLFAILLSLSLLLALLPASVLAEDKYAEHYEYTIWIPATPLTAAYYQDYGENPVVKYLNERFNVTLKFQQPASGSEVDSINLILGTGNYPDMMDLTYYFGSVPKLVQDGVAIDLTPYIDEHMPNYKAFMPASQVIDTYVYQVGLQNFRFGVGTAISLMKSVFAVILLVLANFASNKLTDSGLF